MMDLGEPAEEHGELLFSSEHGSTANSAPNFALGLTPQSSSSQNVVTNEGGTQLTTQQSQHQPHTTPYTIAMIENYAHMNSEYLKRRYKRRHENPEKIRELMNESMTVVENLRTAVEGKMDAAACGVLQSIILAIEAGSGSFPPSATAAVNFSVTTKDKEAAYVEDAGDRQRALFKANICGIVTSVLRELGGHPAVCEKALTCVAYLCRYSEEYKASSCLENAKGFGISCIAELIVSAVKKHSNSKAIFCAACDAVRCLCALESNRDRLGHAGMCEIMARALMKYMNNPEVICWVCRAIGHLSNNHLGNLELMGSNGACENVILAMQKYPNHLQLCIECCYAVRNLALSTGNRVRLVRDFAPETILAVFKHHFASDVFAVEACRAIVNLIGGESDELIYRAANGGYITYSIRSMKRNPDNDVLARWVYQGLYYMACDDRLLSKLVTSEILDTLSMCLENHAGEESMAEWGCRFIEKILAQSSPHTVEVSANDKAEETSKDETTGTAPSPAKKGSKEEKGTKVLNKGSQALFIATCAKLRTAGMCEMTTSAVQRQAISAVVASIGALCIGQLARDHSNQSRLSSSGACEAVVTALKRHSSHSDVCTNTCYAIYYLCKTVNNIAWMGAYGACEAVCNALQVYSTDPNVVRYATLAVAALAYKDEGNLERLQKSDVNNILVTACSMHIPTNYFIAENMCHAISNLCLEPANVNHLGKFGACGHVVDILYSYAGMHSVVTQALIAIAALAVKQKTDKVHKGNTRKLVEKGALEVSIAVMQKFIEYDDVQRAGGLALTALARLEANKLQLAKNNVCELIMHSIQLHISNPLVVVKLVLAIEALTSNCDSNILKLSYLHVIEVLLQILEKHENAHYVVESVYRALINVCLINKANFMNVFNDKSCKLIVKTLKLHEKHPKVAKWGCQLIYTATVPSAMRSFGTSTNASGTELATPPAHGSAHSTAPTSPTANPPHAPITPATPAPTKAATVAVPNQCISEVRKAFGGLTRCPEALVSILGKYLTSTEEGEKKEKDGKDNNNMNNMHNLHSYHTFSNLEVLIYCCMAMYTLSTYEPNKSKFIGQDVSTALLKVLLAHHKENILCEWVLINVNTLLLTNHSEKVRLGQQQVMKCLFSVVQMYSACSLDNKMNIIKLVCDSLYELCQVPYNHHELTTLKEKDGGTIQDQMMGLISQYKNNVELIASIFKALSSITANYSKSPSGSSSSSSSSATALLFGSPSHAQSSTVSSEHWVANQYLDAGLAADIMYALERHNDSPVLVQWLCACIVSLCTKNPRAQTLFASQLSIIKKLTPILVKHQTAVPCITQIARAFRCLVTNSTDNAAQIAKSPVILPLLLELLQHHTHSDGFVEHACYLLGSIEYRPSTGNWNKISSEVGHKAKGGSRATGEGGQASSAQVLVTPHKASGGEVDAHLMSSIATPLATSPDAHRAEDAASAMATTPAATHAGGGSSTSSVLSSKQFYCSAANYDLLFSVLQTLINKNSVLSNQPPPVIVSATTTAPARSSLFSAATLLGGSEASPAAATKPVGSAQRKYNNSPVVRMVCTAVTMFADKGRLHHANLCALLSNLLNKEAVLNHNDENLIQKLWMCVGSLCKHNEQNNTLFCKTHGVIEQLNLYILEYKESNVVLYGLFFALIGICEYNLAANQARIHASSNILPCLVEILYNDLETDFISQFGCTIVSRLTHQHVKIQLKCHNICTYIADVLLTHRATSPVIVLECLKTIHGLAHECIPNRNRLGTSDVCQAVCSYFQGPVMEEQLLQHGAFMKFPHNVYHWGARVIGELAANHANNSTKLGSAGACEILVKMLKRPQQHASEFVVEMKLHSVIYWALANIMQVVKESQGVVSSTGEGGGQKAAGGAAGAGGSAASAAAGAGGAGKAAGALHLNANLMSSLTIASKPIRNSTRLYNLGIADIVAQTLAKSVRYQETSVNSSPEVIPYITYTWGCRLLVNLCKSQRIKLQLQDNGVLESVQVMLDLAQDLERLHSVARQDWLEVADWAQMAKDVLTNTEVPLR